MDAFCWDAVRSVGCRSRNMKERMAMTLRYPGNQTLGKRSSRAKTTPHLYTLDQPGSNTGDARPAMDKHVCQDQDKMRLFLSCRRIGVSPGYFGNYPWRRQGILRRGKSPPIPRLHSGTPTVRHRAPIGRPSCGPAGRWRNPGFGTASWRLCGIEGSTTRVDESLKPGPLRNVLQPKAEVSCKYSGH